MEEAAALQQHPVLQPFFTLGLSQSHHGWSVMFPPPISRCGAGCTGETKPRAQIWRLAGDHPILVAQRDQSHGLLLGKKEELALREQIPPAA